MQNKLPFFPAVVALLFLLAGFALYGSAGHDDSHITFWASYALDHLGEIVNYNGVRVEQSSSLLLTLLVALIAKVTAQDVVTVGYAVTCASGAMALFLCWQLALRLLPDNAFPAQVAIVLLATSPAFMLWNTSGMESTLAAVCVLNFILVWGDVLAENTTPAPRAVGWALLATLMLITVRPEMVMLASALVFLLAVYRRVHGLRGHVGFMVFYATVLLAICSVIGFRFVYFGSPVPLPVFAKVTAFSLQRMADGLVYVLRYGFANIALVVGILLAAKPLFRLFRKTGHPPEFHVLLTVGILLIYTAFIVLTGGDWMQAGRFLVPVLPLAALSTAIGIHQVFRHRGATIGAIFVILAINLLGNGMAIKTESSGIPIWSGYHISEAHQQTYSLFEQYNQEHLRDMETIDQLNALIDALPERVHPAPVTLMSGQSGMVYYYVARHQLAKHQDAKSALGKLWFYDTHALTEASFLKCRLLDDIPRSAMGLFTHPDDLLARQPALHDHCGIPEPDLIYDINDFTRQLPDRISRHGYTLIHHEGGKILENESWLPANAVFAPDFIMVKDSVFDELGRPAPVMIKYNQIPVAHRY